MIRTGRDGTAREKKREERCFFLLSSVFLLYIQIISFYELMAELFQRVGHR